MVVNVFTGEGKGVSPQGHPNPPPRRVLRAPGDTRPNRRDRFSLRLRGPISRGFSIYQPPRAHLSTGAIPSILLAFHLDPHGAWRMTPGASPSIFLGDPIHSSRRSHPFSSASKAISHNAPIPPGGRGDPDFRARWSAPPGARIPPGLRVGRLVSGAGFLWVCGWVGSG